MSSVAAKRRRSRMKQAQSRANKAGVTLAPNLPLNGDHGTGTAAARSGTVIEAIKDSPNRMGRRRRVNHIDALSDRLSMRQIQAAKEIEDAYCRVQMQSSGSPLKEQVDASPKPDAVIAGQVDATSRLVFAMAAVPSAMRDIVEHVCWHNLPVTQLAGSGHKHYGRLSDLKVALDLVANRLRY